MVIRNFLDIELKDLANCHDGEGVLKHSNIFSSKDFTSNLWFINYTVLPPGTTIGLHTHVDNEELYVFLEGSGTMTIEGEAVKVKAGDIHLNPPFGTHSLVNDSQADIRLIVLGVRK